MDLPDLSLCTNQVPQYAPYAIGDYTYGRPTIVDRTKTATLTIGKFCSIADGVKILLTAEHRLDCVTTYPFFLLYPEAASYYDGYGTKGDIIIGNDVWIGANAIILSGVRIGDGAVIGAGAVVTKNVAAYTIVGGNPAALIRKRCTDEQSASLVRIAWWEWPIEKIREAWPLLHDPTIDAFIAAYASRAASVSLANS